jgi:hypothetical protein
MLGAGRATRQSCSAASRGGAIPQYPHRAEDGFTLRDVRRHQWRSLTADDKIQAALDWLEDEDWLRSEASGGTGPGGGRRTVRYRIHPAIQAKRKGEGA